MHLFRKHRASRGRPAQWKNIGLRNERTRFYSRRRITIFGHETKKICSHKLKLSVNDVIVSHKGSIGDKKLQFFGRDYNFCAKIHLWVKIHFESILRHSQLLCILTSFIIEGNIINCLKKTQNKTKILQWRLLGFFFLIFTKFICIHIESRF